MTKPKSKTKASTRSTDETHLAGLEETSAWLLEVIVHDLAQPESKVGKNVDRGQDLEHRELGDGCQGVR
jgi:hypothetical protein